MREIRLDCRQIGTPKAFQIYLQFIMRFPAWYGRNLDALHDMLTEEAGPLHMILVTDDQMTQEMKTYLERVKQVLTDVSAERNGFTFDIIAR